MASNSVNKWPYKGADVSSYFECAFMIRILWSRPSSFGLHGGSWSAPIMLNTFASSQYTFESFYLTIWTLPDSS
ncbi:hypothetical protein E4U30_005094 [Claviceps sp. LM220 group G6]|nr:hypothetical protein E4U30_005094 [Claviceps sp. LM220 group G6]